MFGITLKEERGVRDVTNEWNEARKEKGKGTIVTRLPAFRCYYLGTMLEGHCRAGDKSVGILPLVERNYFVFISLAGH